MSELKPHVSRLGEELDIDAIEDETYTEHQIQGRTARLLISEIRILRRELAQARLKNAESELAIQEEKKSHALTQNKLDYSEELLDTSQSEVDETQKALEWMTAERNRVLVELREGDKK